MRIGKAWEPENIIFKEWRNLKNEYVIITWKDSWN
jgi:hypothetical protein